MISSKKRIIITLSFLSISFLFIIGLSYAFYIANVKGNLSDNPSLKLTSGYLSMIYEDGTTTISGGSTEGITDDLVYTKNFTITNDGVADSNFGIWIKDYKVVDNNEIETTLTRPEDWTYTITLGDKVIKSGKFPTESEALVSVYPLNMGETIPLTFTLTYDYITQEEGGTNQTADMGKVLSFDIVVVQSIDNLNNTNEGTLLYAINEQYQSTIIRNESELITIPGREASLETESIIATTEDDSGTSYYYRGNVENNYVTYSNMCWRIVRVQGDGTIKLALADSKHKCGETNGYSVNNDNGAFIMDGNNVLHSPYYNEVSTYNNLKDNVIFELSSVRDDLYHWLASTDLNLSLIEEQNKWCNDTSVISDASFQDNLAGWIEIYYMGSHNRLNSPLTAKPSLKCNFKGITINGEDTTATTYPSYIGVLTADELAFAGATMQNKTYTYFLMTNAKSDSYWTMTPSYVDSGAGTHMLIMKKNGNLGFGHIYENETYAIRPAIVLKKDAMLNTTISGQDGTINNPYVINE